MAYTVTLESQSASGRKRSWKRDPELDAADTMAPKDYSGAHAALGTDRGHQAPLASLDALKDWKATNYLSNITPQRSDLNQGPWKRLESAVRDLAVREDGPVYVLTGTLYEEEMPSLPRSKKEHAIPSAYWKVVAVRRGSRVHAAAFIMAQDTPRDVVYCTAERHVTVEEVERRTGLDLFPRFKETTVRERRLGPAVGCP